MFLALALTVSAAHADNVYFADAGSWASAPVQIPGAVDTDYHLWVDLSVYDLAYEKDVGIRWTDDNWATWHDAAAWYDGELGGGWQRWGVDITPIGTRSTDGQTNKWENLYGGWRTVTGVTVQFAVYYRAAGGEWWDNNGGQNYSVSLF